MTKVANLVKNKWFIFGVSILNAAYTVCLCVFAFWVFFYNIEYTNKVQFAIVYAFCCIVAGLLMYYTRKSPLTPIFCNLNIVVFFFVMLMDWGDWALLIPAFLVALFGFFCSKMNDTFKTILGTIYLLVYIIGAVAFFIITSAFLMRPNDVLIEEAVSPSGDFKYVKMDRANKATGKTVVYIVPDSLDVDMGFIKLNTTIKRVIKQINNPSTTKKASLDCEWKGKLLFINGDEYFDESEYVELKYGVKTYDFADSPWTHTYFNADYPISKMFGTLKEAVEKKIKTDETEGEATN